MNDMIKKNIAVAGALLMALNVSYAQQAEENPLQRQVDVTRDYRPTVESAVKLSVSPNMVDTVQLRPEFEYDVKQTPVNHGFGVSALSPVKVNASTYDPIYPFYLKAGGGYPAQSLVDLYMNTTGRGKGSAGLYVNHYGQYNKIENDLGIKNKGLMTRNSAGVNGRLVFGRMALGAEVGVDYDIYSRYGQFNFSQTLNEGAGEVTTQKFLSPRLGISLGHDFKDLSRFNFGVDLKGNYFEDDYSNIEGSGAASLRFAKMFGNHLASLGVDYKAAFGNDVLDNYRNQIAVIKPSYAYKSDKMQIGIGVGFAFDFKEDETEIVALPSFNISYTGFPAITPFIDIDSRIEQNTYRSLTLQNPYLNERPAMPGNTHVYDGRAGVSGTISGVFAYKLYAGASIYRNAVSFANGYAIGNSSTFFVITEKQILQYIGGIELEGRVASSLSVLFDGHYYGYDTKTWKYAGGMPNYDAGLKFKWNHRGRFFLTAGADLIGDRWFMEFMMSTDTAPAGEHSYVKVKPVVDVNIEMEYRLKNNLGIFISGHNLAGSKLYQFNHYPDKDVRVNAGVKLLF